MKPFVAALLVVLFFTSCEKDEIDLLNGNYSGTFQRYVPELSVVPETSNVTLLFAGNTFSGTSDDPKYPAICNGTFASTDAKLTVKNKCVFTADFDATLIFNGAYDYEVKGDSLRIWRDYGNNVRDLYLLKR